MMTRDKSNIRKFYLIAALGIRFIAPIRIIYLRSFGLSFSQIGMMELAASIVIIVFEIPTGTYADIIGRKSSLTMAYVLSIVAFSCLSFGSSAPTFIFGWALSGAADAFESGAKDALVFDTLKELGREKDYLATKSRLFAMSTVATIVGSLCGATLYGINHRFPWYAMTIVTVLSAVVFCFVQEPTRIHKHEAMKMKEQLRGIEESLRGSLGSADVQGLIALGLILALPMFIFTTLLNQPYLVTRGFSVQSLGIVFAIIAGVGGLFSMLSQVIENKLDRDLSFLGIFVLFTVLLVLMGLAHSPVVLVVVVAFYVVDNYKKIIIDNYLNASIASGSRATVLSIQSFINNIVASLAVVLVGYFVDVFSIDTVLISMGITVGLACILFARIPNRGTLPPLG